MGPHKGWCRAAAALLGWEDRGEAGGASGSSPPCRWSPPAPATRGHNSPSSCVSPLRRPWHNGSTAKPRPGGQAATWREPGLGVGLWLLLGLSLPLLGGHAAQERVALWKASRTWKPHETVEAKDRFSDTDHLRRESSRGRRISEKRRGRGRGEESKKQRNEAKEKERKAGGTRPSE